MPTTLAAPVPQTGTLLHPIPTLRDTPGPATPLAALSGMLTREPSSSVPLIVHSHLRWGPGSERPRQIFSRLAAHHPVLFVEPPMYGALDDPALQWNEPHPNVVRAIPLLPITLRGGEDVQRAMIAAVLDAWIRGQGHGAAHAGQRLNAADRRMTARFQGAVQWFCSPMDAPCFLGRFGTIGAVYDRAGALAHPQRSAPEFADRDRSLVRQAQLVFFTNEMVGAQRIPRTRFERTGHRQVHRTDGPRRTLEHMNAPTDGFMAPAGHPIVSGRPLADSGAVQARARRAVWDGVAGVMRQRLRASFEAGRPRRLSPEFIAASAAALGLH